MEIVGMIQFKFDLEKLKKLHSENVEFASVNVIIDNIEKVEKSIDDLTKNKVDDGNGLFL
jgi:hypothetical protein